jgi:hypothetical protein
MINSNQNITIVSDCDEVLTNISPLWSLLIHKNANYFKDYFNLIENFDYDKNYSTILLRDKFYLNEFFRKEDLQLTESQEKELFEKFFSLYDNDKFYKFCKPTKMCYSLRELAITNYVNKLYIVSRTTDGTEKGKKEFIEKTFKGLSSKVEFVPVPMNGKKSDILNDINNVNVFLDDELKNVHDIMDNCPNINNMDIYIPKLGYNKPTKELILKDDKDMSKNVIYYNIV